MHPHFFLVKSRLILRLIHGAILWDTLFLLFLMLSLRRSLSAHEDQELTSYYFLFKESLGIRCILLHVVCIATKNLITNVSSLVC